MSRKHIFDPIDASLRRLQTEYVDLYQMHCWDASTPLEETLRALDDLVRTGKVRYIGASNYPPSRLTRAIMLSESRGKTPAQIALNWLLQQPGVTAPIIGACTPAQLEENLGSVGWALSADEMAKLNAASEIPLPSPYNFIARYTRKRDRD